MKSVLKILHLEDSSHDAELVKRCLKNEKLDCEIKVVDDKLDFQNALKYFNPDVILSDHTLPQFDSTDALAIVQIRKAGTPFILVTGTVSEEFAVSCIKNGADDYILKTNLIRLPFAISHALKTKQEQKEKEEALGKLVKSESEIRNFAKHLNQVLEDERAHLAREIHDELGQQLTGIKIGLHTLKKLRGKHDIMEQKADEMMDSVDHLLQSLRKIATQLRPGILDSLGLIPSIDWLISQFEKKTNIKCTFETNVKDEKFEKNISTNLFRICQEALNNIAKHSGASNVVITAGQNKNELVLKISDNGKGIPSDKIANPFSMGLLGMRERANIIGARLNIDGKSGNGTTIELKINFAEMKSNGGEMKLTDADSN